MATTMTFTEAQAYAKSIHPNMFARLDELTGEWDFILYSDIEQSRQLDAKYEGTPAWEAFNTWAGEMSLLEDWVEKTDLRSAPLEIIAEHYNLDQERQAFMRRFLNQSLAAAGFPTYEEIYNNKSAVYYSYPQEQRQQVYNICMNANTQAVQLAKAEFKERFDALDELQYPARPEALVS